jgi:hypothetical protein
MRLDFDFSSAFSDGTITRLLPAQDRVMDSLDAALNKLRIASVRRL